MWSCPVKKPEVINQMRRLHDNFVLVPADKASNNIVFVCKNYYYECLLHELGLTSTSGNPSYTRTNTIPIYDPDMSQTLQQPCRRSRYVSNLTTTL
jgi:hypothetical protein